MRKRTQGKSSEEAQGLLKGHFKMAQCSELISVLLCCRLLEIARTRDLIGKPQAVKYITYKLKIRSTMYLALT